MRTLLRAAAGAAIVFSVSCSDGGDPKAKDRDETPDVPGSGSVELPTGGGGRDTPGANGAPPSGLPFTLLRAGTNTILGVIGDDIVFTHDEPGGRTLEVVPVTGGDTDVVTTLDDGDRAYVRGGVVAFYKDIAAGFGTLGLWTRAAGLKPAVATSSLVGFVVGSTDGSRVAFGVNGIGAASGPLSTDLAVTSTSAPAATAAAVGTVNVGESRCRPDVEMVQNKLFAAFCTPTVTTRARLVVVDAQGTVTTLITNPNNGGIQPFFSADPTGSKLFVIGPVTSSLAPSQGRIVTVSPPSVATLENDVEDGFMAKDGSAAIYFKGGAMKRATATATPTTTTLVADGIIGVSALSATRVLFHTQTPPEGGSDFLDLKSADLVTENQPGVTLVGTPTASSLGFAPGDADALYLTDFTDQGATLQAVAAAGGAPRTLVKDVLGALPGGTSAGVVVVVGAIQEGDTLGLDLAYVPLTGGDVVPVAGGVLETGIRYSGKHVVYARLASQGGGLFVTTLP